MELIEQLNIDQGMEILEFLDVLHQEPCKGKYDGWIGILRNNYKKPYSREWLQDNIHKFINEKDVYITPNTFDTRKTYKTEKSNVWSLKNLYVDLDVEKHFKGSKTVSQAYMEVLEMSHNNEIPHPTIITFSGKGLHIYWSIGDYNNKTSFEFWEDVQKGLYEKLKPLGADSSITTDSARVLRIPNTINSKNNKLCEIWYIDRNKRYSLLEIKNKYLLDVMKVNKPKKKATRKPNKAKINTEDTKHLKEVKSPYTLNKGRCEDIEKLIELRGYSIENRNITLFILANAKVRLGVDQDKLYKYLLEVNNRLIEPLGTKEIFNIARKVFNHKNKKEIEKDNTTRNVCLYPDSVIDSTYPLGYKYSTARIIEDLDITREEMAALSILINSEEKNARDKERKKQARRGEDGLTKREQKKKDTNKSIHNLKNQGLTQVQVAERLALSPRTVQRHWNETL